MARKAPAQPEPEQLIDMHLPEVPARDPRIPTGTDLELARQAAERAIMSGSHDPVSVAAGDTALPWELARDERTVLERSQVLLHKIQQLFMGRVLLQRAREGMLIPATPGVASTNGAGAAEELKQVEGLIESTETERSKSLAVLEGTSILGDGSSWPGQPIAPGAENPRPAAMRETIRTVLLFTALLIVEGVVVTVNMYAYQRTTWIAAAAIAITALSVLTFGPFLLGTGLARIRARAKARAIEVAPMILVGLLWIGVGVSLALVRVQVDQGEAVAKIEERQEDQVAAALEAGEPVPVFPEIDPQAVFDPTLPSFFWIAVLLGFGAIAGYFELTHYNPVRRSEASQRGELRDLRHRRLLLVQRIAAIEESVAVQEDAITTTSDYFDVEIDSVVARGEAAKTSWKHELIIAAGDPEMLGAIETRNAASLRMPTGYRSSGSESGVTPEQSR